MESLAEALQVRHGRIDVHHHLFPPAYKAENARRGITEEAGVRIPDWTPEQSLDVMDSNGIQTAILSLSAPGVYFGDKGEAVALARSCNDYAVELSRKHPGRFGSFAVLPMPFTHEACDEAAYALDVLGADGIVLLGSVEGHFLGDPRYDELMSELDRRQAIVFVHPNLHPSSLALDLMAPGFVLEFPCDTSRAALNLILRGVTERHPRIRWILSHAGGFLPYIGWRASLVNAMSEFQHAIPQGFLTYLRRFYFDTALSPSPISMAALRELVEPDHILFGSDFPYAPAAATSLQVRTLEGSTIWDETVRHGIDRTHALRLFPRYAGHEEPVIAAPVYEGESLGAKARRLLAKPVSAIAEHLRDR
ncbi:putative TIM-barrel fold metal-dependent hydrolase [Cupriavidus taiwanensis]|uniref:amidohydrolase family protein n=1 Tax=Cupriavidus taiwanensis TaxID=164546 RepID=UPI000E15F6AE|nr:amidohydrolase family protein [Cupriavidus taiwanensis]SOY61653.1 putative TIM-barrel fold metal-dependent hydrolase [Cupriavidus taiwanensis]SOY63073.1 putative TIM-barrel fold metal-dependent hydrolase [Cupriavidus taiwanensis]SOY98148.1 putative TIM-barrel fold metal-dependent hydrolase [Cupriavidus taiwanensis]SOZ77189.1 putative TIM-barrel fold metal-dependent hydrolase [Cupriavidus taiwanensis]SOZ85199.1 putative TIM-barrel fold metal-dependent hydrolase [Cupriavidus taiwanensis]